MEMFSGTKYHPSEGKKTSVFLREVETFCGKKKNNPIRQMETFYI
jgi:hypothetical protein